MDGCLINWRKSHFPFLCQYATGCHPRMGSWGADPRPPHYGAGLTNSFFSDLQWSLSAVSYFWLFCFLPKMKMKMKETNRFNAETVVANYHFGAWNIGTLKGRSGEVCEVLRRRKVKVCCIQEVRWKGEGSRALQGYKLIWKGNSEGTAGVGVLVASELVDRIIRVERISDSHCCWPSHWWADYQGGLMLCTTGRKKSDCEGRILETSRGSNNEYRY